MDVTVNKRCLVFAEILFVASGLLYAVLGQAYERIFFILTIIFIVSGIRKVRCGLFLKRDLLSIIFILFICSFFLDAVVYFSIKPAIYGISMLFLYWISKSVFLHNETLRIYDLVYKESLFFTYIVVIFSVLKTGIYFMSYRGIMQNPNTMGIFAGSMLVMLLAKICDDFSFSGKWSMFQIINTIVFLAIVVISSCRTAFVGVIGMLLYTIYVYLKTVPKTARAVSNKLVIVWGGLIAAIVLVNMTELGSILQNSIIDKFSRVLINNANVTNGRSERWVYIIQRSKLLGDGTLIYEGAAHNIYFGLMNQFGKITAGLFFIFVVLLLFASFKLAISKNKCRWKHFPILATFFFLCVSMMENYMMTSPMILMFICIPMICKGNQRFIRGEKQWLKKN